MAFGSWLMAHGSRLKSRTFSAQRPEPRVSLFRTCYGTRTRMPLMSVFVISSRFLSFPSKHAYSTGT
jgi:hypothetical protein